MKYIVLVFLMLQGVVAQANVPAISKHAILLKDISTAKAEGNSMIYPKELWCANLDNTDRARRAVSFGSLPVAQQFDALAVGTYSCDGDFVTVDTLSMTPGTQIFSLSNCAPISAAQLKDYCH